MCVCGVCVCVCVCTQLMYKVPKGGSSLPVLCSLPFLVLLPHKNNLVGKFRGLYSELVWRTKGMGKTVNINSPLRSLQVLLMAPSTNTRLQEDCDSLFLSLWGTRGGNLCPRDKNWETSCSVCLPTRHLILQDRYWSLASHGTSYLQVHFSGLGW